MKKLLAVVLALALMVPVALAEGIDLSGLSFDELVALRDRVTVEITKRAEWKEVTVPAGAYEIGVDIPAGYWTITCTEGSGASVEYGKALNEAKTEIANYDYDYIGYLSNFTGVASCSIDMKEGYFLVIDNGSVIFSPYIRPSLGF